MRSHLADPVRVRALFDDAADLAPDERDAFIADACAGDDALREEVLALLACLNGPTLDAPPPAAATVTPDFIGRFAVLGKLGEGGMGVVLRGRDHALDRDVALKLVNHGGGDEGRVRLLREAQAMARVAHPNVVPVYEVGVHREQVFIAMELVRGTTLTAWRRAEPRGWREVLRVLVDAGRGLSAAHRAGLLHRDVKPDNVLIGDDGRARVVDFGLARASAAPAAGVDGAEVAFAGDLATALTHDGAVVGSPGFMSPEHFVGTVSAAADQWSLAATAYHALFGRLPFIGRDVLEIRAAVLTGTPPLPPPGEVPRAVVDAVMRGLARRPEARFASVEAFVDALAAELAVDPEHDPQRFRRQRRGLAITIAAAGAFGFVLGGARSHLTFDLGMRWLLGQSLIGLVILISITVALRRALWATVYDRRVMSLIMVAVAAITVHRALAFDASVTMVLRTDAVISISLLVVGAITLERWLALSAAVMTTFLLLSLVVPGITVPAFHPTLVSTIALGVWFWREPRRPEQVSGT